MAINEITISPVYATMMTQLYNALNDSGLFTNVQKEGEYRVHCYIGTTNVLTFYTGGWSNAVQISCYDDATGSMRSLFTDAGIAFYKMMTTSKGVVIGSNDVYWAFIGKTIDKNGNVSAGIVGSDPANMSDGKKIHMCGKTSKNITQEGNYNITPIDTNVTVLQNAFTTDDGSEFFENIYLFSAFESKTVGKVKIGDIIGYSNGYVFIPE